MSMSETLELVSANRSFGGWHKRYRHYSRALDCDMVFAVYLPPQAENERVPLLWWLSGLTCNDENFMQKAGAHRIAAELGVAIVCPDTSPRGTDLPGEHESFDLGSGAGFYVNATEEPWKSHYRMYDYVIEELPSVVRQHFPVNGRESISGHSMGGQGEADQFLEEQLQPERLEAVCEEHDHPLTLRRQPGYDHSYFFIASFIEDHLRYHADHLMKR